MGVPRTLGATTVVPGAPVPAVLAAAGYSGVVLSIATLSIMTGGYATITLSTASEAGSKFPTNGFNGPNGYPTQNGTTGSEFDIQGKWPAANGQQITMWGFTGAGTALNGKVVSVVNCNPSANAGAGSFSFYFGTTHLVAASDTGLVAPSPWQHYRAIRLECSQSMGSSDFIYVGDLNVSSTRYVAALSLAGQLSVEVAGENIPADRVFIDGTTSADSCQVSLIY
jgi:hypothetical protein